MQKLQSYHWPGNVRELRNVIERAVALGTDSVLDANDIWLSSLEAAFVPEEPKDGAFQPISLEEMEKRHIARTLNHTSWNKTLTAVLLGIERSTLDRKIKAYDLKRE